MSCYIRYMKSTLNEIGINPQTKEDRKDIDFRIREIIGKDNSDKCNEVWKEVKIWLKDEKMKEKIIEELKSDF